MVDPEPGKLTKPFTVYVVPVNGRVQRFEVLGDPDDLDEIEPAYRARASYSVWKGLLTGQIDPVEAVLKRRIVMEGDLQQLLERMKYKGIADRLLGQIATQFIDG